MRLCCFAPSNLVKDTQTDHHHTEKCKMSRLKVTQLNEHILIASFIHAFAHGSCFFTEPLGHWFDRKARSAVFTIFKERQAGTN